VRNLFEHSREDGATYAKWCRAALVFYGSIGLMTVVAILATYFSSLPVQLAGN
jgi:hypothetical protein